MPEQRYIPQRCCTMNQIHSETDELPRQSEASRLPHGKAAAACAGVAARLPGRVPVRHRPPAGLDRGLPLCALRPRDVGATFAAGGLLYDVRQPAGRRHLCISRGSFPADGRTAFAAGAGSFSQAGRPAVRRNFVERVNVGVAARGRLREVPDASAVRALCRVAGRRTVVGGAAAVRQ